MNVARVLASFGVPVQLLYTSGGTSGLLLDTLLADTGLHCRRIAIDDATRICFNVHDSASNLEYRFVAEGPVVQAREVGALLKAIDDIPLSKTDYVIASGSLPRGVAPGLYADISTRVARRGAHFVLDTSGPSLTAALQGVPVFLVKPSLGELSALSGQSLDQTSAPQAALELVQQGKAQHVVVSMANKGALLASADGVFRLPALEVPVASAVGAGDTFLAAMISRLVEGQSIHEAFRLGVAAGAAAVMTPGTNLSSRSAIEALLTERGSDSKSIFSRSI